MCIRFFYRGNTPLTAFNFDIDPADWDHQLLLDDDCFAIGILRPDGQRHTYHGVHKNGNVGTLLYVHGAPNGAYDGHSLTIAELTERFVRAELSFDEVLATVQSQPIVYAPDATMQAILSDARGRVLFIEPGVGWRAESARYSLMANGSALDPASTAPYALPGDVRETIARQRLTNANDDFSVADAFTLLHDVRQEGQWATRLSFVYAFNAQTVYYCENNRFDAIRTHHFS